MQPIFSKSSDGAVHKRRPTQNREKLTPPTLSALTQPTSSLVRAAFGHTIISKTQIFCTEKCEHLHLKCPHWASPPPYLQNVHTGQTSSPLTADVFYE